MQPREYRHFISSTARLYKRPSFPFHFRIIIHSSYTGTASTLFFLVGRYFRMVRFSNNVIGLLNFATFVLSVPILGGGIWLAAKADTDCEKFLQWPMISIGAFLMLVSLAGLVGTCCRITWLMWFYLAVMFILILLLFCFIVFAFVVTNKGVEQAVSGKGYKEYRLGDYSNWLQKRVEKSSNKNKIKSCLRDAKVCKILVDNSVNEVVEQFYKRNLSPIQPPTSCNFSYVNATYWTSTTSNSTDVDCSRCSNEQDRLCYSCNSCKAGVLANLRHDWRKIAIINIVVLIALVVVYSVGCCAFRNNRRDERNGYGYKGYP